MCMWSIVMIFGPPSKLGAMSSISQWSVWMDPGGALLPGLRWQRFSNALLHGDGQVR